MEQTEYTGAAYIGPLHGPAFICRDHASVTDLFDHLCPFRSIPVIVQCVTCVLTEEMQSCMTFSSRLDPVQYTA